MPQHRSATSGQPEKPPGAVPGEHLSGGLLETCPSEEHVVSPAELLPSGDPQRLLSQRGRDELGRIAIAQLLCQPQGQLGCHGHAAQPVEQLLACGSEQLGGVVHGLIIAVSVLPATVSPALAAPTAQHRLRRAGPTRWRDQ